MLFRSGLERQTGIAYSGAGVNHANDVISYSDDWMIVTQTTNEYDHAIVSLQDSADRIVEEKQIFDASSASPSEFAFIRAYSRTGQVLDLTLPSGRVYNNEYDSAGRLDKYKVNGESSYLLDASYDSAGRDIGHAFGNGTDVEFAYRNSGVISNINHTFTTGSLNFGLTYDASGLVVGKTNSRHSNLGESYHYDGADRLDEYHRTGTQSGLIKDQSFNLDPLGNWTSTTFDSQTESRSHNELNQITGRTGTLVEGATSPLTVSHDDAGNLTNDGYRAMTWDANNRLVSVEVGIDSPVGEPGTYYYKYDIQGRRISAEDVDSVGNPITRIFLYDGWRVMEERIINLSGTGENEVVTYPLDKMYTWGPRYLDELVSIEQAVTQVWDADANEGAGGYVAPDSSNSVFVWDNITDAGVFAQRYYAHQDNIFNVCAITSNDGEIIREYAYNFSGKREQIFDSSELTPSQPNALASFSYGNTAQRHDDSTGLMYWKNRYYSIEQGRFINRDPLGYIDGTSLYQIGRASCRERV